MHCSKAQNLMAFVKNNATIKAFTKPFKNLCQSRPENQPQSHEIIPYALEPNDRAKY